MDLAAIKSRVNLVELVGRFVELKKDGFDYIGRCPFHNERTGSFRVYTRDPHFHCFGCGERGDCFDFVFRLGVARDFVSAAEYFNCHDQVEQSVADRLALRRAIEARNADDAREAEETRRYAYEAWRSAQPAGGTMVEAYLRGRGYMGAIPRSLRYAPRLWCKEHGAELPAMVAGIVGPQGAFQALHRTWLQRSPDGLVRKANLREAKKSLGRFGGGAIRLFPTPFETAAGGFTLYVGEGIETSLTILEGLKRRPDLQARAVVWAGVSLTNMSRLKLPMTDDGLAQAFAEVVLVMDNDMKDTKGAETCVKHAQENWEPRGITILPIYPKPGADLNDVLQAARAEILPPRIGSPLLREVLDTFPGAVIETIDGKPIERGQQ